MSFKDRINSEKGNYMLELVVVIFLGISSVMGSLASFQSGLQSSAMSKEYNEGTAMIMQANSSYVSANQEYAKDTAIYMELVDLQYDWMYSEEGSAEEERAEEAYDEYANKFVSEALQAAIDWADEQEAETGYYTSPLESEEYLDTIFAEYYEEFETGRTMMEKGHDHNTWGDQMGQVVVEFAMVLFLLGICGTLRNNQLKLVLMAFSLVVFVIATVEMVQIPFLSAY